MKKKIIVLLVVIQIIASSWVVTRKRTAVSFPCHNNKKYLTKGAINLLDSYIKVFQKPDCSAAQYPITAVDANMPANQYSEFTDPLYSNKWVTFETVVDTRYPSTIRNVFDCLRARHICQPDTIYFPYPCDTYHTDDGILTEFVPVDSLKRKILNPVWNTGNLIAGITVTDIRAIKSYYLEGKNGYIAKTYPEQYVNKYSALGIVCNIYLKSGKIVSCYLINNDMAPSYPERIKWKI